MSDLTPEERDRLWQHALHEDTRFNERLNFFVTLQSVLLALAALVISSNPSGGQTLLRALGVAGLLTCAISWYVQVKHVHIVALLTARCREVMPEFQETCDRLEAQRWRGISSKKLLAHFLPVAFAVAWLVFFFPDL